MVGGAATLVNSTITSLGDFNAANPAQLAFDVVENCAV
jgi:hypothetical protein